MNANMNRLFVEINTGAIDTLSGWQADWAAAAARGELEEMGWEETWEEHISSGRLVPVE